MKIYFSVSLVVTSTNFISKSPVHHNLYLSLHATSWLLWVLWQHTLWNRDHHLGTHLLTCSSAIYRFKDCTALLGSTSPFVRFTGSALSCSNAVYNWGHVFRWLIDWLKLCIVVTIWRSRRSQCSVVWRTCSETSIVYLSMFNKISWYVGLYGNSFTTSKSTGSLSVIRLKEHDEWLASLS